MTLLLALYDKRGWLDNKGDQPSGIDWMDTVGLTTAWTAPCSESLLLL